MAKKAATPLAAPKAERVILLVAGESGSGKSFFVANLHNALIFDTDIGGGLAAYDARIERNGSERVEIGSYPELIEKIGERRESGHLDNITTLVIDHLSTLHQEAVIRHNPRMIKDFGAAGDKAAREWRKVRELVRVGDFNLVCTSHLKGKWEDEKVVGEQADAAKKIEGDFHVVLHVHNDGTGRFPKVAHVNKWRRDPEDVRGKVPPTFPFTVEKFLEINGASFDMKRQEIPMAKKEQIAELEHLLSVVKLPEETVQKWMTKAKAESFAEFPETAILSCIDFVRKKLQPGNGTPATAPKGDAYEGDSAA